ncbi:hypothetical protein B0I37DRAFT_65244 [Chaetomium sp. MPI-CAGE-AT-0009]|nr:hypothetical protein B0I37DRAFT_65244 [Chaetomium sp. MPI-CAGE-AT-0009]
MALASLPILCAVSLVRGQGEQLEFCGSVPYYASEYSCYDNKTLCPRLFGQPTLPCSGACYSPDMYQCRDGQLELLPVHDATGTPFKLQVHSSNPALNNSLAKVCNLQFNVGEDAETCVYCFNAPPQFVCSEYRNETVLLPSGAMDVDVPGSQYWFVDPTTGRLRTTAGGKANGEGMEHTGKGVTIYQDGYFSYDGSSHWFACKEAGGSQRYVIFAPTGNSNQNDCERIKLVTVASTEPKEGAYVYT